MSLRRLLIGLALGLALVAVLGVAFGETALSPAQ